MLGLCSALRSLPIPSNVRAFPSTSQELKVTDVSVAASLLHSRLKFQTQFLKCRLNTYFQALTQLVLHVFIFSDVYSTESLFKCLHACSVYKYLCVFQYLNTHSVAQYGLCTKECLVGCLLLNVEMNEQK